MPFDPKCKGRKKGSLEISGKRVSLTGRTERTKVLVSPVGLEKCEKRESKWAGGWDRPSTDFQVMDGPLDFLLS